MVSTVSSQHKKDPGSNPQLAKCLSVCSLHVLPVAAWVLSGYSGFLPSSKDMQLGQLVILNWPCDCLSVSTC